MRCSSGGLSRELAEIVMNGSNLVAACGKCRDTGKRAILLMLRQDFGGQLVRIAISHAEPVGLLWLGGHAVSQWAGKRE